MSNFRRSSSNLKNFLYISRRLSQFTKNTQLNFTNVLARSQVKHLQTEYKAVVGLLSRSFNLEPSQVRRIHLEFCRKAAQGSSSSGGDDKPQKTPDPPKEPENNKGDKQEGDENNKKNKNDNDEKLKSLLGKAILWVFSMYTFIAFASLVMSPRSERPEGSTRYVSWNEFVHHMLAKGEVKELIIRPDLEMVTIILHEGAIVKGKRVNSNVFHMAIADATKFEEKLRKTEQTLGIKEGVPVMYDRQSDTTGRILMLLLVVALFAALVSRMKGMKSPLSMDSFSQMGRAQFTLVDPFEGGRGVLFKDVAGLREAKQEVMEFVDYLKTPGKYQRLGAKVPKGALLLGPPGCGKTLLAKAVATEAQVPFLSMNGSEFIEMIGGLGAARVRDLFAEAKKRSPCIIYIDEIDAIGRKRSGTENFGGQGTSGESEQTLNQLLVEMDGMASKAGVLMLASTNRADILDKALLRPGRFDRHILIDFPNLIERKEIFEKHLSSVKLELQPSDYSSRLARLTPGFSGADIANVCNEAALHAARHSQKKITAANLEYAVERLVGGTEKRSHALSPMERKTIAYHESGHALVGWLLPNSDLLLKVTIVPRTSLALGFAQYTPSDQHLYSKEELFDKMCMALGGRAAENLTFDRITTGAQNDLEKVTQLAYSQIKKYGMNEVLGPIYIKDAEEIGAYEKPYSQKMDNIIDWEARKLVTEAYAKTEEILKENKDKLKKLAEALLEKEALTYEQVENLIGPPAYDPSKRLIDPVEFEQSMKNLTKKDD